MTSQKHIFLEPLQLLLDIPPDKPKYLIEDLLIDGGTSLMIGKPKSGKSTLVRNLIKAVADGGMFLGRKASTGKVLYFALEEQPIFLRDLFVSLSCRNSDAVFIQSAGLIRNRAEALLELKTEIENTKPRLIIIDPVFKFGGFMLGNDYAHISALMSDFSSFAKESNCHVCLVHHANKGTGFGGDSVLGSTAWFAGVDTGLFIERKATSGYIKSQQRYGVDLPESYFKIDRSGLLTEFGDAKDMRSTDLGESILSLLNRNREGMAADQIIDHLGARRDEVLIALKNMAANAQVQGSGTGKRGSPIIYQLGSQPKGLSVGTDILEESGDL